MSVTPTRDRRAERREATRAEILEAAWELAREAGLAGVTLRDIGAKVGMRAQSLYSYFDSKVAIYDAMFRQGNEELLERLLALPPVEADDDPAGPMRERTRVFVEFGVEDPARMQLMFQRVVPGFEPAPEAYAPAVAIVEHGRRAMATAGITSPEMFDLWTAVVSGLIAQQTSNDPGGDRWSRLIDDAVDMFLAYARSKEGASA